MPPFPYQPPANGKKIVYSNELMLKLRHMAPAAPALDTIPEGARSIFVLPNVANVTVHTVAVHKKVKNHAAAAAASFTGFGTALQQPATAAAGFTVTTQAQDTPATAAAAAAAAGDANESFSYAAALKAMSDAERDKLQEVRNAFATRASENRLLMAAAAAANAMANNTNTTSAAAAAAAAATEEKKKVGWNTAAPTVGIDIAAAATDKKRSTSAAKTAPAPAAKGPAKQWTKVSDVAAHTANISEFLPSQPISRNERKRQEDAKKEAAAASKKSSSPSAKGGATAVAPRRANKSRAAPQQYPAFMVQPAATGDFHESFFVGPDGRQYPMPPNPFANVASQISAQTMDAADWYGWWAQQAAFYPEYVPVPIEVPVDAMGNVLPITPSTREVGRIGTNSRSPSESKRKVAEKKTTIPIPSAPPVVTDDDETRPSLGKGRASPAVLSGDSLEARHRQRERQILLGKRTMGYFIYERIRQSSESITTAGATTIVTTKPSAAAIAAGAPTTVEIPSDCHAPPFSQPCSKRSWDGQVRRWRNALHKLDKYAEFFLSAEELARFPHPSSATAQRLDMNEGEEDDDEGAVYEDAENANASNGVTA